MSSSSPSAKRIKRDTSFNDEEEGTGTFEDDLAMLQVSGKENLNLKCRVLNTPYISSSDCAIYK